MWHDRSAAWHDERAMRRDACATQKAGAAKWWPRVAERLGG